MSGLTTFKEYLIEGAKPKKEAKVFDAQNYVPKMKKVLDQLIKKTAMEGELGNELVLLELLSIVKEVLVSRLEPYAEDPKYAERKANDTKATVGNIEEEISDVFKINFPEDKMRSVLNTFKTLIVGPILDEVIRVTPAVAANAFDNKRFDENAKDDFGDLMRHVIKSEILPNAEDAAVAQRILAKWGASSRRKRGFDKLSVAQQKQKRLQMIKHAVAAVQETDDDE